MRNEIVGMKDICEKSSEGDIKGSFYRTMKSIDDKNESITSTLQELENILRDYVVTTKAIDNMA